MRRDAIQGPKTPDKGQEAPGTDKDPLLSRWDAPTGTKVSISGTETTQWSSPQQRSGTLPRVAVSHWSPKAQK